MWIPPHSYIKNAIELLILNQFQVLLQGYLENLLARTPFSKHSTLISTELFHGYAIYTLNQTLIDDSVPAYLLSLIERRRRTDSSSTPKDVRVPVTVGVKLRTLLKQEMNKEKDETEIQIKEIRTKIDTIQCKIEEILMAVKSGNQFHKFQHGGSLKQRV